MLLVGTSCQDWKARRSPPALLCCSTDEARLRHHMLRHCLRPSEQNQGLGALQQKRAARAWPPAARPGPHLQHMSTGPTQEARTCITSLHCCSPSLPTGRLSTGKVKNHEQNW